MPLYTVTVMMNAVPAERSGGAAVLQETAYELGNVLGIAGEYYVFIYIVTI
ncbi:hypothetical protein [Rickettsia sp. Tenjiku01]|uniref:hypothetical protein n=1 Tax=Rickettsia sp. Tenjiku01 TaxID=1736693 RepID=UPI000AC5B4E0|nr:hypothetical protein [Rickettsia sp. Tenjiku01]